MNEVVNFILFLFASALAQNIVLATGFGSSMLLRIIRRPKDIGLFSLVLSLFAVLTVAIAYPIDKIIGISFWAKLSRPLIIVGIALILYSVITPIAAKIRISGFVLSSVLLLLFINIAMMKTNKVIPKIRSPYP